MHRSILACRLLAVIVASTSVVTLAAPGDLDPSFGVGGIVTTDLFGEDDFAASVVIQLDGKIVVAGSASFAGSSDFALVRYNANGSLDSSFGIGGKIATDFSGRDDYASALVLQSDGKLVAAGRAGTGAGYDFGLARYNADGSLDGSFGLGGLLMTAFPMSSYQSAQALVLQPDGKLVAAGFSAGSGTVALARYNSDGALDTSFGNGGLVATDVAPGFESGYALVLQPDGKLVVAGSGLASSDFLLVRYQADGSLDNSFGSSGVVTTDFFFVLGDIAQALALQPDGKLIAAGRGSGSITTYGDTAMARYLADGSLDPSFGSGGRVFTDFVVSTNATNALLLQADGRMVAAGYTYDAAGETTDLALARYHTDGTLDLSFGAGGRVTTDVAGGSDYANALAQQVDDKIVVVGHGTVADGEDFVLARYDARAPACSALPAPACKTPIASRRAYLELKDSASGGGDRLTWRWHKGAATTLADFGDPLTSDDYVLCAYDESGGTPALLFEVLAAASGLCDGVPCWSAFGAKSLQYRDRARTPLGLDKLVLGSGAPGRAQITLRGRGANLPPLGLPLPLPARVQLQAGNGACWEAVYSAMGVRKNTASQFAGVAD